MKKDGWNKEGRQDLPIIYAVGLVIIVTIALGTELYYSYQFTNQNAERNIHNIARLISQEISIQLRYNSNDLQKNLNQNTITPQINLNIFALNDQIDTIDLGNHSTIEIIDLQSRVILRKPNLDSYNQTLEQHKLQLLQNFINSNKTKTVNVLRTIVDGKTKIYAIEKVNDYPLFVLIGSDYYDVFFLWYAKVGVYITVVLIIIALLIIAIQRNRYYLQQTQELMTRFVAMESADDMIVITSKDGTIEYVNPAFTKITGYTANEVIGYKPSLLKSGRQTKEFYHNLWKTILSGKSWKGELINCKKDGNTYVEEMTIAPVKNSLNEIIRFVAVKRDISDRKQLEAQLAWLAHFDKLTGLPNRVLFFDRLERVLAQSKRQQTRFAIFFLDLDGFKLINDYLGHQSGDLILQEVAQRLSVSVRKSDTVARMGGDEFTLILVNIRQRNDVIKIAQTILLNLSQRCVVNGQECQIGASIGISFYPDDGTDLETLLNKADTAMYRSKHQGKNCYEFASPEEDLTTCGNYFITASDVQTTDPTSPG